MCKVSLNPLPFICYNKLGWFILNHRYVKFMYHYHPFVSISLNSLPPTEMNVKCMLGT